MNFADAIRKMEKMSFLIGESDDGRLICADIDQNPHLFISGVTGTGKSVFLHSILLSLMFQNKPEHLRFILCDSKIVELAQYNGTSHLLIPVLTDSQKIKGALHWAEYETYKRLNEFVKLGKRSLQAYNDYLWEKFLSENGLPRIIIVIDDISDISMQDSEMWDHIKQIILKGRTVGIHLLIVTQAVSKKGIREIARMIPSKVVFLTLTQQESKFLIANASACQLEVPGNAIFSGFPGNGMHIKTLPAREHSRNIVKTQRNPYTKRPVDPNRKQLHFYMKRILRWMNFFRMQSKFC